MASAGIFGEALGKTVAVGWDDNAGLTVSVAVEASVGVSASAWASFSISPGAFFSGRDAFSAQISTYSGIGTPPLSPIAIQVQRNHATGDEFISFGLGADSVGVVGVYYENGNKIDVTSIETINNRFISQGISIVSRVAGVENGYTSIINFAIDEHGNRLTPIDARPFLLAAGYPLDPNYNSLSVIRTSDFVDPLNDPGCFLGNTMVSMWPLDVRPDANGRYDQDEVRAKIWEKPIQYITVEDSIVSYDKDGLLIPGRVTRTMINHSKHILDVFGLKVTPGHVTLCGDGAFEGRHVPILDILRSDGALVRTDGSLVRAVTNCPVGSREDQLIWAVVGTRTGCGTVKVTQRGQIRLGTRTMYRDQNGKVFDLSIAEAIRDTGLEVTDDGMLRRTSGDQTPAPFHWIYGTALPKPEDYVLQRSGVTLEDIYSANEWESVPPQMPEPLTTGLGLKVAQH